MSNFVDELKKYIQSTPLSKIKEVWDKSIESDEVGPTVEEFLSNHQSIYCCKPRGRTTPINNKTYDLEFSSGLFF